MSIKAFGAATVLRAIVTTTVLGGGLAAAVPAAAALTPVQRSEFVKDLGEAIIAAQPAATCDASATTAIRESIITVVLASGATPEEAGEALALVRADLEDRLMPCSREAIAAVSAIIGSGALPAAGAAGGNAPFGGPSVTAGSGGSGSDYRPS